MTRRTIIDANSIGHGAQHGHGKGGRKLVAGGVETTAIFGMLLSIQKLLRSRTAAKPILCWDGRSHRYITHPDYKGNRADSVEKQAERQRYRDQRKAMAMGLHLLGLPQLLAGNLEADDLAGILTRRALAAGDTVTLVTSDKDWLQLVQLGVAWFCPRTDRKCNVTNFEEFTGYKTPKAFIHSKALQGDAGDNVPGCGGIGKAGAIDLLSVFDCVHSFQAMEESLAQDAWHLRFGQAIPNKFMKLRTCSETKERFEFALELMDLGHPSIPAPIKIRGTKAALNRPGFEDFCREHAFMSLLNDMDNFLKPFITLQEEFGS